jgi:pilus assembly protein Flp/PilA
LAVDLNASSIAHEADKGQESAMRLIQRFISDESAATAIEYAMIALFVSVALIAGATTIGQTMKNLFYGPLAANMA